MNDSSKDSLPQDNTGHRFGSRIEPTQKYIVTTGDSGLPDTNDGAHLSTTTPAVAGKSGNPHRTRVRDLGAVAMRLSQRDWAILNSVAMHRFLTVRHIQILHFGELAPGAARRITQRVLARLRQWRILAALPRRVGGTVAGSDGLTHHVDEIGWRLLQHGSGRVRRRFNDPSTRFVDHQLAIADAHTAVVVAQQTGKLELVSCDIDSHAWRHYLGLGGARLQLKPDLYLETSSPPASDYIDLWFIEVDRGTESIPVLLSKCRDYVAYYRTGIHGNEFPQVLWLLHAATPERLDNRRQALTAALVADKTLPASLFQILTPDQLIPTITKGAAL